MHLFLIIIIVFFPIVWYDQKRTYTGNNMQKLIFLDADGTLWFPRETQRTYKPHWIYLNPETKDNYLARLELAPQIRETLVWFREQEYWVICLSAHPHGHAGRPELAGKLEYFNLHDLFHDYYTSSGNDSGDKARLMREILTNYQLSPEQALMIGDSYTFDYCPAEQEGISAYWIENYPWDKSQNEEVPQDISKIQEVYQVIDLL